MNERVVVAGGTMLLCGATCLPKAKSGRSHPKRRAETEPHNILNLQSQAKPQTLNAEA